MENKIKISVIMSVYNAEKYIDEAIQSILKQTFKDFEFIIIDDGSIDKSGKILQNYKKKDPRIVLMTHTSNFGLIHSLNEGFRLAKGKYLARMDADDISLPDRFLKQCTYLDKYTNVIIVGSLSAYIDDSGIITSLEPFFLDDAEIRNAIVMRKVHFRHGSVMIRRKKVIENNVLYDINAEHYEDYEYWPRLLQFGQGKNLNEVLYLYRRSKTNITSTKMPAMSIGSDFVRKRELKKLTLNYISIREAIRLLKKASAYRPKYIFLENKKHPTYLNREYQAYLFRLAKIYLQRQIYFSGSICIMVCFLVNPIQFIYFGFINLSRIKNNNVK